MNKAMRHPISYSIWFLPQGQIKTYLTEIIWDLSASWKGPHFVPHITLFGGVDETEDYMRHKARLLAEQLEPFDLKLGRLAWSEEFFRSFYLEVQFDHELRFARKRTLSVFEAQEEEFFPHLSLYYGTQEKAEKTQKAKEIKFSSELTFRVEEIFLAHNNEIDLEWIVLDSYAL